MTTNKQGLTAQQMGQAAQEIAQSDVTFASKENPGQLQTSNFTTGKTSSNTGGIVPVDTKFQAYTAPTKPSAPLIAETSNPNVLTASDGNAYVNSVQSSLNAAAVAQGQKNAADLAAQGIDTNTAEGYNKLEMMNPYNDPVIAMKKQYEIEKKRLADEQKTNDERLAEKQQGEGLTQKAINVSQGVAGSPMGDLAMTKLNLEQARTRKDYADQKKKLLDEAWRSIGQQQIAVTERKLKEAQALDTAQEKADEDYTKKQKALLELQKADAQEGGAIYSMVQAGYEPDDETLEALDMMRGYNPGTSRTLLAAEQAIFNREQDKEDRIAYKDNIQIEKDLADLEDRPMDRQSKLLDIQKKLRDSQMAVYDEMSTIFDAMEKVPEGMQVSIGDASYFGIEGGAIFEKTANGDGNLAFRDSEGNIQVQSVGNWGKAEDTEIAYVNGMQVLVNKKTQQLMPVNVGNNAQPGARVWSEKYPDGSVNPYRAANDPVRGECGAYLNDIYSVGKVWGNTLSEKLVAAKQYEVPRDQVQVDDSIVMSTNAKWGHVAIVSQVFEGPDGKTMIQLNESNFIPPGGGKISNSRTMAIDDPRLKAVARIPLNPERAPSSPADSLNVVGDAEAEINTEGLANPFIIPGRVYNSSQQLAADEKWRAAQAGARDLLAGGDVDDIEKSVLTEAKNLARQNGWESPEEEKTVLSQDNPFVTPNVVMTPAQMVTAENKWAETQALVSDLVGGAKEADLFVGVDADVKNMARRLAKEEMKGMPKPEEAPGSLLYMPTFEEFKKQKQQEGSGRFLGAGIQAEYNKQKAYVDSVKTALNAIKRGKFTIPERDEFVNQANEAVKNGDIDSLENIMNQVALKSMSDKQQDKYQASLSLVETYEVGMDLLASFAQEKGFQSGNLKKILENAKKKGNFDADPRYTEIEQLLATSQGEFRNALFGASLTPGEMAEADKMIINAGVDTPATMWNKMNQGAKMQRFAADVRLADALGMPRPKLKDYLK